MAGLGETQEHHSLNTEGIWHYTPQVVQQPDDPPPFGQTVTSNAVSNVPLDGVSMSGSRVKPTEIDLKLSSKPKWETTMGSL